MEDLKLTFFTRRFGADITLRLKMIDNGWHISHKALSGDADREGAPLLTANFEQDGVKYPVDVGGFIGFIWGQLHSGDINTDRAQHLLNEVGAWISKCETTQPVWKEWNA